MDDKDKDLELPGFKINYNGSDESSEDDFAAREGDGGVDGAETTVDAVEAVPAGNMSTENGSVTHGEGENKPVMLENESLGGLSESALKTAPGGLKTDSAGSGRQFAGHVGENADGNAGDSSGNMGEKQGITEAEARAMLIEDNARAKEDLKKANAKGRKTLVVVTILAVVLIIAGVAVSVILGGRDKDGNNDKQEGNGEENAAVVEKPEEMGGKDDVVYGYAATCFESGDGTFQKRCDILELHTKEQNTALASYEGWRANEDGRREGGGVSFLHFVDNKICYLNDYIFGEYAFQTYQALSCVDLSPSQKIAEELLVVESNEYNTLDYLSVVTDKYIYYHSDRWGGTWLRYDIQTRETVNTGVSFDETGALYYSSGVLVSGTMENDELTFYGRDADLNMTTEGMPESDLLQSYPMVYEMIFNAQQLQVLYIEGKKMWLDKETHDVYCDDRMIYDYPNDGNGVTSFRYDPLGQKAIIIVSDHCGAQTCDYQLVKYNVETDELTIEDDNLGYDYWTFQAIYLNDRG